MSARQPRITDALICHCICYLKGQERSNATIQEYTHNKQAFQAYLSRKELTKIALIIWK